MSLHNGSASNGVRRVNGHGGHTENGPDAGHAGREGHGAHPAPAEHAAHVGHALHPPRPRASGSARSLIAPQGGALVDLWASPGEAAEIAVAAPALPRVTLNLRQQADLELLANGAYSPLRGFMEKDDLESVLERGRLASGIVWTIPIVLAVDDGASSLLRVGERIGLEDTQGHLLAVMDLRERYAWNRTVYAQSVFRTTDGRHPGVQKVLEKGEWLLGGPLTVVRRPDTIEFPSYHLDPAQTRTIIQQKGWRTVVGFQTRNPIHRAHEFILKSALEIFDGLLIQPLVGETRPGDVPAQVRLRCYEALLEGYYPKDRILLAVLPAVMRFAGPREAVFHALIRKNYGCTHFIVGRDHAGVGGYYGPYDAQRIFDEFEPEEIGIQPLRFENSFFCTVCQSMASFKTCPHPPEKHLSLSGTKVREMLAQRELPPAEFTRPEVARILMEASAESDARRKTAS